MRKVTDLGNAAHEKLPKSANGRLPYGNFGAEITYLCTVTKTLLSMDVRTSLCYNTIKAFIRSFRIQFLSHCAVLRFKRTACMPVHVLRICTFRNFRCFWSPLTAGEFPGQIVILLLQPDNKFSLCKENNK